MHVKSFLACAIFLTIAHNGIRAEYDVDAYCTLVKNGMKLASVDNCQTFYTCNNGKATAGECPASQSFDKDTQICRPKSDVNCYFGVQDPCAGKHEQFVPVDGTCNWYIYCKNNAEVGRNQCPLGMVFHANGNCIYGNCNDNVNSGIGNQGLTSVCQIMPMGKFFGSSKNCKLWQLCVKEGLKQGECEAKDQVFDVNNQNCNFQSGNMCSRVTGQDIQPDPTPETSCDASLATQKKADSTICSNYFYCDGLKWTSQSCGNGMYFTPETGRCESRQTATPIDTCNRCQFSKKQFVNAVDPACRGYLICQNGNYKGRDECGINSYFDETAQACIVDANGKTSYSLLNGACKVKAPPKCEDVCAAMDATNCEKGTCDCGIENGECVVCADGVESNGDCVDTTPPIDCPTECAKKAITGNKCKVTDCTCGIHEGKCADCAAGNCNLCICAGACTDPTCECVEDAGVCTVCDNGIDAATGLCE